MISIIICSINPISLGTLKKNIRETIGVPYEVIAIDNRKNKHSITNAYNLGAEQAQFESLCFVHEDVVFHTSNWGNNLIVHLFNKEIALLGVLGCTVKTKAPSGVYSNIKELNRINQIQRYPDQSLVHYYENPNDELFSTVSTLDGIFLACTAKNWKEAPFDSTGLKGFHGYDIDFSLSQRENGKVVVVYDILIEHISFGKNTKLWIDAQLYITEKWKNILPLTKGNHHSQKLLKSAENENNNEFIISLIKNNYKKRLTIQLALKMILMKPFQRINLYFLKNIPLNLLSRINDN